MSNLDELFKGAGTFNEDISGWHVGNVRSMRETFMGCRALTVDLSAW